jgi:redox-sensitive bicupin YhaK (pirin superfamily)
MLDSFDSTDPDQYTAGFPMHPHRGIETITYVYRGQITHRDNLGNEDTIADGEVQWMTAGSGILHEEKLPAAEKIAWSPVMAQYACERQDGCSRLQQYQKFSD